MKGDMVILLLIVIKFERKNKMHWKIVLFQINYSQLFEVSCLLLYLK